MSSDGLNFAGVPSEEMEDYLQLFLDETAEQLDAVVETLLRLENDPRNPEELNEAFRLIHSIKGSAGLMGLDSITVLTHHLENHFERLRSGLAELDRPMMSLILRCVDFLKSCNERLRAGKPLAPAPELLEELTNLHSGTAAPPRDTRAAHQEEEEEAEPPAPAPPPPPPPPPAAAPAPAPALPPPAVVALREEDYRVEVHFEPGLPLVDLKAELVLARLGDLGTVRDTRPGRDQLEQLTAQPFFQVLLSSSHPAEELRAEVNIDGVVVVEVQPGVRAFLPPPPPVPVAAPAPPPAPTATPPPAPTAAPVAPVAAAEAVKEERPTGFSEPEGDGKGKVSETVRVDIDRLDRLMNLTGELVVNKARFVQIARQMGPAFRKSSLGARARNFGEVMRRGMHLMRAQFSTQMDEEARRWLEHAHEYEAELDAIEEQARLWEQSRRGFGQIAEAIDQLSRVAGSLQRGVLETRMVPVGPLFGRFKRVVRDIALEMDKKVNLEIKGEKTELDKRMIDALGDPLVHLIRNAIDHGLETPQVRRERGKPEAGTLHLEAAHSGNNVFIFVRDDGGGISARKIRQRLVKRGILGEPAALALPDRDAVDFIWHPGFSTAEAVSDISGRGVGMDIVKTRIAEINGTIEIDTREGEGTTFTIRLPLTLAIIRSLLFRVRHGIFAVPLDNVREIVSVPRDEIISVHGRRTFEVRREFVPLVDIDEIFDWPGSPAHARAPQGRSVNVVLLQSANRIMGVQVDELHGGQDIVIKSLAENFVAIRGLSGASILGDGSVCLLLDVASAMQLALNTPPGERGRANGG